MGWLLIPHAADQLPASPVDGGDAQSLTVALIVTLGSVIVALIGWAATRSSRTSSSPPVADPTLGERFAVTEHITNEDRRTLTQLDRLVDGIGDLLDRVTWRLDAVEARLDTIETRRREDDA